MEMNCISTYNSGLSSIEELNSINSSNSSIFSLSMDHQMSSILVSFTIFRVTSELDITGKQYNFSIILQSPASKIFFFSNMGIFQFRSELNSGFTRTRSWSNRGNLHLFRVSSIKISSSNSNEIPYLPFNFSTKF